MSFPIVVLISTIHRKLSSLKGMNYVALVAIHICSRVRFNAKNSGPNLI